MEEKESEPNTTETPAQPVEGEDAVPEKSDSANGEPKTEGEKPHEGKGEGEEVAKVEEDEATVAARGEEQQRKEAEEAEKRKKLLPPDPPRACVGAHDGSVHIVNLATDEIWHSFADGHSSAVRAISVDWEQNYAVSGASEPNLILWSVRNKFAVRNMKGHKGGVWALEVDWESFRALSASDDGTLRLWNLQGGDCLLVLEEEEEGKGHQGPVWCVAADWQEMCAVSGGADGCLVLWDLNEGCLLRHITVGHPVWCVSADWGEESQRVLCGLGDGALQIWDIETEERTSTLIGHRGAVWKVVVDWVRMRAVSGSCDTTIRLWDLNSSECTQQLRSHINAICALLAFWEKQQVISSGRDGSLFFWDLGDGSHTRTLDLEAFKVSSIDIEL